MTAKSMDALVPVSILASGRGSNFDAILNSIGDGRLGVQIVEVVSDQTDAPVIQKAKAAGLKTQVVSLKGLSRDEQGAQLMKALDERSRFLVLAGFMRILSPAVIRAFSKDTLYSRIVNVHPGLLPAFPGLNSYRQAFDYGAAVTGVTIHLVDEKMDHGPICAQEAFSISDCQTAEEVEMRGLEVEHRLYPETLSWVLQEKFRLIQRDHGRFCVRPS